MEALVSNMLSLFKNFLTPEIAVFVISMMPILELRGGLIAASLLGLDWKIAMLICIIGNLLPIPFIMLFIKKIMNYLKNTKLSGIVNKIEEKAEKNSKKIFAYGIWGLYLFVAVPIPGTGAWTGALVASLFGIRPKVAFLSMIFGIFTAAIIMAIFSYGVLGMIF